MFASKLIFVCIAVLTPFTIAGVNITQYEKVLIDPGTWFATIKCIIDVG